MQPPKLIAHKESWGLQLSTGTRVWGSWTETLHRRVCAREQQYCNWGEVARSFMFLHLPDSCWKYPQQDVLSLYGHLHQRPAGKLHLLHTIVEAVPCIQRNANWAFKWCGVWCDPDNTSICCCQIYLQPKYCTTPTLVPPAHFFNPRKTLDWVKKGEGDTEGLQKMGFGAIPYFLIITDNQEAHFILKKIKYSTNRPNRWIFCLLPTEFCTGKI